ncbi:hypothetical protein HNY73_016777 [Argiope bruennichi]|uniref:Uncharacterized protein n=1 Tax=Argiope bruennichi TaxID=94029 RepID=A0A8T0EPU8_ARGBR|nr:hypothetical protein HNY73_016777 [Argiope bruennichi]
MTIRWRLCCITYDEEDIIEPLYGEHPSLGSAECDKEPEVLEQKNDIKKIDYVLETLFRSDWPDYEKWRLCCITYDEEDIIEPPYGEHPSLDSAECDKEPEVLEQKNDIKKTDYVLETLFRSDWPDYEKHEFFDRGWQHVSDESTYYPDTTTNTATSETEASDTEAYDLYHNLKDIYQDLTILSKKLDEIAALQKLL